MRVGWIALLMLVPAPALAAGCPATFADFWARFRSDVAFQKANTAETIRESWMVDDHPRDYKRVVRTVPRTKLKYPIVFFPADYEVRFSGDAKQRVATVHKPDTDALTDYVFDRRQCWTLVRKKDWSL